MAIPNPVVKFTYEAYLNAPEDKRLSAIYFEVRGNQHAVNYPN